VFATAGGYVATGLMVSYGVPFLPAVLGGVVATVVLSVPLEQLLYRRLYGGDELDQVLLTIGLVFMSVAVCKYIWGPLAQPFQPPEWLSGRITLAGREFPAFRSFVIVAGAATFAALWLGLERTRFGAQIRAAVDNRRMAQSVGINTSRLFTWSFALGSGLAALGGSLGAEILAIEPAYALEHLVYFLIVVSVGGMGSIRGPFVAALLLGVLDTGFKYLLPDFGAFFIYAITLVVLLVRPRGLFGLA
jgi:branched-chain amino acid transport system permease protein